MQFQGKLNGPRISGRTGVAEHSQTAHPAMSCGARLSFWNSGRSVELTVTIISRSCAIYANDILTSWS
jgi:hypothetical protein